MNQIIETTDIEAQPLSAVVRAIKVAVSGLPAGWVEAEINNVSESKGHLWLELAGADDVVKAVIWRRDAQRIQAKLREPLAKGQKIAAYYRVDFYGPHGQLRLMISDARFIGEGELRRRRLEILARLQQEGLCEHKRPLPPHPRWIGIIAGQDSDGLNDVAPAIRRRWPPARIKFVASLVQGPRAPDELIRSLLTLDADPEVDVIALCRGGGSVKDLVAFDNEELCRIIANCQTPVVAAIGHARNRPNAYHVADVEAPVPHAVAELVVPDAAEHGERLDRSAKIISRSVAGLRERPRLLDQLSDRLRRGADLEQRRLRLADQAGRLRVSGGELLRVQLADLDAAREAIGRAGQAVPRPTALDRPAGRLEQAISQSVAQEQATLDHAHRQLDVARRRGVTAATAARERLTELDGRVAACGGRRLRLAATELESAGSRRSAAAARILQLAAQPLDQLAARLAGLDPTHRGYSLIRGPGGQIIDSVSGLQPDQVVELELHDGRAESQILNVTATEGDSDDE